MSKTHVVRDERHSFISFRHAKERWLGRTLKGFCLETVWKVGIPFEGINHVRSSTLHLLVQSGFGGTSLHRIPLVTYSILVEFRGTQNSQGVAHHGGNAKKLPDLARVLTVKLLELLHERVHFTTPFSRSCLPMDDHSYLPAMSSSQ